MSYPAPIHREDREAIRVAAIPLLKSPPRDRILRGVGIYLQPENPIQVLRSRGIRMTYIAAFAFSQESFPFTEPSAVAPDPGVKFCYNDANTRIYRTPASLQEGLKVLSNLLLFLAAAHG